MPPIQYTSFIGNYLVIGHIVQIFSQWFFTKVPQSAKCLRDFRAFPIDQEAFDYLKIAIAYYFRLLCIKKTEEIERNSEFEWIKA